MGDVQLWFPAMGRNDWSSNSRSHRQAKLPAFRTTGMLFKRILRTNVKMLESRSTEASEILGDLSNTARNETRATKNGTD